MANSIKEYPADTDVAAIYTTPDYIQGRGDTDIKVYIDDVLQLTSAYTLNNTAMTLNSAPTLGQTIRIERRSDVDGRLTDYSDGALLTADTLDLDANQIFHVAQEAYEQSQLTNMASGKFYYSQTEAPTDPVAGTLWYNLSKSPNVLEIYDGTEWHTAAPTKTSQKFGLSDFTTYGGDLDYLTGVNYNSSTEVYLNGVKLIKGQTVADVSPPANTTSTIYVRLSDFVSAPYYIFSSEADGSPLAFEFERGTTYTFIRTDDQHPFYIGDSWGVANTEITASSTGTGPLVGGVASILNGEELTITIPSDFSGSELSYFCTIHSTMIIPLNVGGDIIHPEGVADYYYEDETSIEPSKLFLKDIQADDVVEVITYSGGYASSVAEASEQAAANQDYVQQSRDIIETTYMPLMAEQYQLGVDAVEAKEDIDEILADVNNINDYIYNANLASNFAGYTVGATFSYTNPNSQQVEQRYSAKHFANEAEEAANTAIVSRDSVIQHKTAALNAQQEAENAANASRDVLNGWVQMNNNTIATIGGRDTYLIASSKMFIEAEDGVFINSVPTPKRILTLSMGSTPELAGVGVGVDLLYQRTFYNMTRVSAGVYEFENPSGLTYNNINDYIIQLQYQSDALCFPRVNKETDKFTVTVVDLAGQPVDTGDLAIFVYDI